MILADTSIWTDHLRKRSPVMVELLGQNQILMHALVIGELALGMLQRRDSFLRDLSELRHAPTARIDEVMTLIEARRLWGLGIGWIDINLLASALIAPGTRLWTRDKRLHGAAQVLGCDFSPAH